MVSTRELPKPDHARFASGHYESRFIRANHPDLPLAFWIRHTVRVPRAEPHQGIGEVWAIYFNGLLRKITHSRQSWPLMQCRWGDRSEPWQVGTSKLMPSASVGSVDEGRHHFHWDLAWHSTRLGGEPGVLLPRFLYDTLIPTPKTLTLDSLVEFKGNLTVDGRQMELCGWRGSNNHNWGSKHSEDYVWAQVCGFDNDPEAYFEGVCSRPRLGTLSGPTMTLLLLRMDGEEWLMNGMIQAVRNCSTRTSDTWTFDAHGADGVQVHGLVEAQPDLSVSLPYHSPCGAVQTCRNSKLAKCSITVIRPDVAPRTLLTEFRAAFETLATQKKLD